MLLNMAAWNCYEILNSIKIDLVIDGFNTQLFDMLLLSETQLNLGNNMDLSSLDRFTKYSLEKDFNRNKRGAEEMIVLVRPGLEHMA